jgi:hypothetical protein
MGQYTHPTLGEEIRAAGGHYVIAAEKRLPFQGREVLVATGYAMVDSSCCGLGGCGFALVPGYVTRWRGAQNQQGKIMSDTEPVREEREKAALRRLILASENVQQVNFW